MNRILSSCLLIFVGFLRAEGWSRYSYSNVKNKQAQKCKFGGPKGQEHWDVTFDGSCWETCVAIGHYSAVYGGR
jgi:hypothetical protein